MTREIGSGANKRACMGTHANCSRLPHITACLLHRERSLPRASGHFRRLRIRRQDGCDDGAFAGASSNSCRCLQRFPGRSRPACCHRRPSRRPHPHRKRTRPTTTRQTVLASCRCSRLAGKQRDQLIPPADEARHAIKCDRDALFDFFLPKNSLSTVSSTQRTLGPLEEGEEAAPASEGTTTWSPRRRRVPTSGRSTGRAEGDTVRVTLVEASAEL